MCNSKDAYNKTKNGQDQIIEGEFCSISSGSKNLDTDIVDVLKELEDGDYVAWDSGCRLSSITIK